jgi:hypothetical protein
MRHFNRDGDQGLVQRGTTICATVHSPQPLPFRSTASSCWLVAGASTGLTATPWCVVSLRQRRSASAGTTLLRGRLPAADFLTDIVVGADRGGKSTSTQSAVAPQRRKVHMDLTIYFCRYGSLFRTERDHVAISLSRCWSVRAILHGPLNLLAGYLWNS